MEFNDRRINGTRVYGGKLAQLISSRRGTLFFKENELVFIPASREIEIRVIEVPDKAEKCVGFTSENFKGLSNLETYKVYIVDFGVDVLRVIDPRTGEEILEIEGTTF
jgi:hypothetical protein